MKKLLWSFFFIILFFYDKKTMSIQTISNKYIHQTATSQQSTRCFQDPSPDSSSPNAPNHQLLVKYRYELGG